MPRFYYSKVLHKANKNKISKEILTLYFSIFIFLTKTQIDFSVFYHAYMDGHEQRNVARHAPHDCFYSGVQIKMHKNDKCLPISNLNAALLGSP